LFLKSLAKWKRGRFKSDLEIESNGVAVANIANEAEPTHSRQHSVFHANFFLASREEPRVVLPLGWNKKRARKHSRLIWKFAIARGGDDERNSISLMRPAAAT
jgi:hypothetical protein